ncbi:MAG TPA: hypothetical protein VMU87_16235 [Stellaceae bacterium]|nr:hypothetical protein [Stellaceae bacterium]
MRGGSRAAALTTAIGLCLIIGCGGAIAQGAPPPPSVSVPPVASREVMETADFIGRITAVNRVEVVARVQAALGRVGAAPVTNQQPVQLTITTKGRLCMLDACTGAASA